jgi:SAM-dependent methyltransferase
MAQAQPFDRLEYKQKLRKEWQEAAVGWRDWYRVVEGEAGGQRHSAKLVELARLRSGAAVLDVGTGYGEPGLTAARMIGPSGRVVCADISGPMLAFARERAAQAGLDNVEFIESDAEALDFPEASFDAVVSRATLMFMPDPAGMLARLRSFLKPGGRLAASVWGEAHKVQFAAAAAVIRRELQLPAPLPGLPGPFALADAGKLAALLRRAGFREVETGTLSVVFETDTPEQYTQFIRAVAPPFTALVENQPADVRERIWDMVTGAYREFVDANGRVRTTNEAIWVAGSV